VTVSTEPSPEIKCWDRDCPLRTAEEKVGTIRTLQGQLATATGDDVQSVTNRIAKAKSIGVRK